jgi:hypothetical protein
MTQRQMSHQMTMKEITYQLSDLEDEQSYNSHDCPTEVEEKFNNKENYYQDEDEYDYEDEETFHQLSETSFLVYLEISECWRHSIIHTHMMNWRIYKVKLPYIKEQ